MITPYSATSGATRAPAPEQISARFRGVPLPRGLREVAATMSWSTFTSTYSPSSGPLRLGHRIETATAAATGPVAALTAMLYDRGLSLEMLRFHQLESGNYTATFIQGCNGERAEWGMGWSEDKTQSALRAVIACANRLLTAS